MLARALESAGISTTSISLVREHTEKVKPPRALWVPFPFGHAFGRPNDPALQHRVLRAALDLLSEPAGPVLRDFPDDAEPGDQPAAPTQASAITPAAACPERCRAGDDAMRRYHERWLEESGGRTALGLTGIPPDALPRHRALPRGLRRRRRRPTWPSARQMCRWPDFIRYCADDLKALYYEGTWR